MLHLIEVISINSVEGFLLESLKCVGAASVGDEELPSEGKSRWEYVVLRALVEEDDVDS
jgi:hypothetical protein